MVRFVLASASPARLSTLHAAGLRPDVVVSGVDESTLSGPSPAATAAVLAAAKADAVAGELGPPAEDTVVLGCDSLLEFEGAAFGKPADVAAARRQWQRMRGHHGVLHTGHAVRRIDTGPTVRRADRVASTVVRFGEPSDAELDTYLASGEPLAVAGGFTVDGLGSWFVDRLDGDHHNVVGLSLRVFRSLLTELDVSLIDLGWPAGR